MKAIKHLLWMLSFFAVAYTILGLVALLWLPIGESLDGVLVKIGPDADMYFMWGWLGAFAYVVCAGHVYYNFSIRPRFYGNAS